MFGGYSPVIKRRVLSNIYIYYDLVVFILRQTFLVKFRWNSDKVVSLRRGTSETAHVHNII